ncbi:MAG: peptidase T [Spirochaetia bacterium]|jgi:tripeptide aminopeptidase|nr:peptidase T [Spirochaetia bacterium]
MSKHKEALSKPYVSGLVERFLRYAKIDTQSDRHIEEIPSTKTQWNLAHLLMDELKSLGISDVSLDEHCYIIARLPASPGLENKPVVGLMAHMDTASDVPGSEVRPRLIEGYDGKALKLAAEGRLDPAEYPDLADHAGDSIIVTDGSTLLGADDKAGLAEIMTSVEWLTSHPEIKHGPIEVFFTPDEETGKGMNLFPLKKVKAVACYTFDGGKAAEIEAECFNAYQVRAEFTGKVIHIGAARGKLANATAMACHFVSMLPRSESPEATDNWYGYYCPIEIQGSMEKATVDIFLRDFSAQGMEQRINAVKSFAAAVEAQFPLGRVSLEVKKQYLNMKEKLDQNPAVLEKLAEAIRQAGAEPVIRPIRGGTDGSRLTEMGIPTPNVFTGGYNYHSKHEWASVAEMSLAVQSALNLLNLWAQ